MWIAIVYERTTELIEWNAHASEDDALAWVVEQFYSTDYEPAQSQQAALAAIRQDGYVVHIEAVGHLAIDVQHGIRFPNDLVAKKEQPFIDAAVREANERLRAAGSPDRVDHVARSAMFTDWKDVD